MHGSEWKEADQGEIVINADQEWQCRWWSKEFGVAPEQLKEAIQKVGPIAKNVRKHLATPFTSY